MANALLNQSSPYLKESSNQPVNWQPWGKAAFDQAKEFDKPLIVSIGYHSCHWCRQMARDNYEDSYIASIMNRHFVCIKVDREERPDLDLLYMEASRMFNQSAGWPLHAFCLPDGAPFWCGTYFPKEDQGQGIAPWPQVLLRIAEHFRTRREELIENGKNALANLAYSNHSSLSDPRDWQNEILLNAGATLEEAHDDEFGGFTPAPKFPSPMKIDFLFALSEAESVRKNQKFSKRINFCLKKTLGAMKNGRLFDHVNGGFFRYCLDREWTSPHFEKMLSDNALLISTYSRAWRKFRNPQDLRVIELTWDWIKNEMGNSKTGYATSLSSETNQMEGAHYLWTHDELQKTIGSKDALKMEQIWGPFAKASSDLFLPTVINTAEIPNDQQLVILEKLKVARNLISSPERDEKKSCAVHALLVRALVDAGVAIQDKSYLTEAFELLQWMESVFRLNDSSVASILYPDQSTSSFGFLEDYAFWAEAILSFGAIAEIWDFGKLNDWVKTAEELINLTVLHFKDPKLPGFFTSLEQMENAPPVRKKSWHDHAIPSGNSSLLRSFHTLGKLGKEKGKWQTEYNEALGAYTNLIKQSPDGIGHALTCQTEQAIGLVQISGSLSWIRNAAERMATLNYRPIFYAQKQEQCVHINGQKIDLEKADAREIEQLFKA